MCFTGDLVFRGMHMAPTLHERLTDRSAVTSKGFGY